MGYLKAPGSENKEKAASSSDDDDETGDADDNEHDDGSRTEDDEEDDDEEDADMDRDMDDDDDDDDDDDERKERMKEAREKRRMAKKQSDMNVTPESRYMVYLNEPSLAESEGIAYPDNVIVSSKYTILTFLPLNLFEQVSWCFFFFLFVSICWRMLYAMERVLK